MKSGTSAHQGPGSRVRWGPEQPRSPVVGETERTPLATPNYSYEKRQRELAKKRKKEEKLKRKSEHKSDGGSGNEAGDAPADDTGGQPDRPADPAS
jgi:hypothetical protein